MVKFQEFLKALHDAKVEMIIVGGLAAIVHGSSYITNDLDICYRRTKENHQALIRALKRFKPKLRGRKGETIPFLFDEKTLQNGLNFTLTTTHGDIDLLGELQGIGGYEPLLGSAQNTILFDMEFKVIGLADLIHSKKIAGRKKDNLHLDDLEVLRILKKK